MPDPSIIDASGCRGHANTRRVTPGPTNNIYATLNSLTGAVTTLSKYEFECECDK